MNKRGFAPILVLLVAVGIFAVSSGVYFYLHHSKFRASVTNKIALTSTSSISAEPVSESQSTTHPLTTPQAVPQGEQSQSVTGNNGETNHNATGSTPSSGEQNPKTGNYSGGVNNYGYGVAPACPSGPLFSVSPVPLDKVVALTPLGDFSPPDHVFPPPHQYFYVINPNNRQNANIPIYAPGDITLTQLGLRHYNQIGSKTNYIDYTLVFSVCDKFDIYFHHVTTLNYQPFEDAAHKILPTCSFSQTRNEDFCQGNVNIPIKAGEQIGTVGDLAAGVFGLDIGARDYRTNGKQFANPQRFCQSGQSNVYDRCYTVCAFDYFMPDVRQKIVFSSPMGTESGLSCGSIYADAAGTAQGYWVKEGVNTMYGEANALFLGPTNMKPGMDTFSIGTSMANVNPGTYNFNPMRTGLVDRIPSDITADGKIYCYDTQGGRSETDNQAGTFIIQLIDATHLQVEKSVSACGSGPWQFQEPTIFIR